MKIDLSKIDAQIHRLEELRRLASDPELLNLLETVVVNGNGSKTTLVLPIQEPGVNPVARFKEGTIVRAVAQAAVQQQKAFTGYSLADEMIAEGYQFVGKTKPGVIVADILRSVLIPKEVVRVYRKGKGSEPTTYVKI